MCGLVNKLPHQVHSSTVYSLLVSWNGDENPRVPWKLLAEDDKEATDLDPWKIVWSKSSLLLSLAPHACFTVSWEKELLLVSGHCVWGLFVTQVILNNMASIHSLFPHPLQHIFIECWTIMGMGVQWWMVNQTDICFCCHDFCFCSNCSLLHCLYYIHFYLNTNVKHYLTKYKIQGQHIHSLLNSMQRKWILDVCINIVRFET